MLAWLKKKQPPQEGSPLRGYLFGDAPLGEWVSPEKSGVPWDQFMQASKAISAGKLASARRAFETILSTEDLESRQYLEAWHCLRGIGGAPSASVAKHVYGAVIEVHLEAGLDIVAAYADHSARYINHSGAGVVWQTPDRSLDDQIDQLLEICQQIANAIGPWQRARPAPPKPGNARINMLTPSGLHFGEGAIAAIAQDGAAGPAFAAAQALMQSLIEKSAARL